jgi:hypothetical protein
MLPAPQVRTLEEFINGGNLRVSQIHGPRLTDHNLFVNVRSEVLRRVSQGCSIKSTTPVWGR